jgi:hypothetical protein
MRRTNTYGGRGVVIDGSDSYPASYRLDEFQQDIAVGRGETIPGLKEMRGEITMEDSSKTYALWSSKARLTLEMDDGRRISFFFVRPDGTVTITGGFH